MSLGKAVKPSFWEYGRLFHNHLHSVSMVDDHTITQVVGHFEESKD